MKNKLMYVLLLILLMPVVVKADLVVPQSPAETIFGDNVLLGIIVALVSFVVGFLLVLIINKVKNKKN